MGRLGRNSHPTWVGLLAYLRRGDEGDASLDTAKSPGGRENAPSSATVQVVPRPHFVHMSGMWYNRHKGGTAVIRYRLWELWGERRRAAKRPVTIWEIAQATGISRGTLSRLLNDPGYVTTTRVVDKLCEYFGCQPGDLLVHIPEKKPAPGQARPVARKIKKPRRRTEPRGRELPSAEVLRALGSVCPTKEEKR